MTSPADRKVVKTDLFFIVILLGALLMLGAESFSSTPGVPERDSPVLFAAIAALAMFALSLLTTMIAARDRRHSDEYAFRLMSSSALIAIPSTLFFHMLFGQGFLLGGIYGRISADGLYAVLLGSWAIGYFTYRVRGTAA